jgi:hypothetical protein
MFHRMKKQDVEIDALDQRDAGVQLRTVTFESKSAVDARAILLHHIP